MREARDEPEVAERLAAMEYGRYEGPLNLLQPVHRAGQIRKGLTLKKAATMMYAIASPDTYLQLRERGMSPSRPRARCWTSWRARSSPTDHVLALRGRRCLRDRQAASEVTSHWCRCRLHEAWGAVVSIVGEAVVRDGAGPP